MAFLMLFAIISSDLVGQGMLIWWLYLQKYLGAVPTQLSTLCLKINCGFSVPREENHFVGLAFSSGIHGNPEPPSWALFARHWRSGGSSPAASRWHWEAAAVPEVVLEISGSSEKHCSGIGPSPALKMVLVALTVSRWLVTLSPTTLWRRWVLFWAAKNKTSLVLPVGAVGREEPNIPKVSWHELRSSFLLLWAPGRWCSRVCTASGFLSAFPHSLVPGDLEQQLLSLESVFLCSRMKYIDHFFSAREQVSTKLLNKLLLKESELQEWFCLYWPCR